ncbi:dihydrofolate reductase [Kribbella sandramycini]|uniref:Dihydrofolate reductase n=1 Tax=Kribbella sandramycini TaxID=60450 RepID=A0A7Y4KWF6_9ACTN|nr:dihydrofolate reductase family protein [Kribbella sandramycini]MBB6568139.1 dihydrofolate reductase [Kribbella sandramycini]NOL39267.1 dihydrofolate reductase [Kribbella sandramycini]
MSRVVVALAVSVDGYISGRTPSGTDEFGRGLGDAGRLFDWYFDGDTPSAVFGPGFKLSAPSARIFDELAGRDGAVICGRTTYEHSSHFGGGSPHPKAPLVVLSREPVEVGPEQTLAHSIEAAVEAAFKLAHGKDVGVMGGGATTSALQAGLVDELVLHQVPILLGGGHPLFRELTEHIDLRLIEAIPAPGVTHLRYAVVR